MNVICGVEQLAAREAHNLEVAGSNPAPTTPERDGCDIPRAFLCASTQVGPNPVDGADGCPPDAPRRGSTPRRAIATEGGG